jgi:hypothetical protein
VNDFRHITRRLWTPRSRWRVPFSLDTNDRDFSRIPNCILTRSTFYIHRLSSRSIERNFHPRAESKRPVESGKASNRDYVDCW